MTAQTPEIIILNGKVFGLHSRPLDSYFQRIKWWPELGRDSGNWRGYVGRWEVFGERLFLTGLFGKYWKVPSRLRGKLPPDPDPFEPAEDGVKSLRLADLFPDQAPLVFAEWVTERLVVPTGPRLVYLHAGFGSLYATYRTLEVVKGRVRTFRDWDVREWARETGHELLLDRIGHEEPKEFPWPQQNPEGEEGDPDDEFRYWRDEDDPRERVYSYEDCQIEALRKPCGQTPTE